jgi:multicomponent Na+:H+ antiporter subunit C
MIAQFSLELVLSHYNYWIVIFLMMTGFYLVIARGNLIKTIIGLNIFQTSVVLLYVTMGKVSGGKGAPIMPLDSGHGHGHDDHGHSDHGSEAVPHGQDAVPHADDHGLLDALPNEELQQPMQLVAYEDTHVETVSHAADAIYSNPLPSVLMLTAIVVGVATTALALALTVRIREEYGTIEEDEILELDRAE